MTTASVYDSGLSGSAQSLNGQAPTAYSGPSSFGTPNWEASSGVTRNPSPTRLSIGSGEYVQYGFPPWKSAQSITISRSASTSVFTIPDVNQDASVSLVFMGTTSDSWVRVAYLIQTSFYGPVPPSYLQMFVKFPGSAETSVGGWTGPSPSLTTFNAQIIGSNPSTTVYLALNGTSHTWTGTIPTLSGTFKVYTSNMGLVALDIGGVTQDTADVPQTTPASFAINTSVGNSWASWASWPSDATSIEVEKGLRTAGGVVYWTPITGTYVYPPTLSTTPAATGAMGQFASYRARFVNSIGPGNWVSSSEVYVPQVAGGSQEYQRIPEIYCWWFKQGRGVVNLTNPFDILAQPSAIRVPYSDVLASMSVAPRNTVVNAADVALLTTGRLRVPWVSANGHDPRLVVYLPKAGGVLLNVTRVNVTWVPAKPNSAGA